MDSKQAIDLGAKIIELQTLMIAFVTDGRTHEQPAAYKELYAEVSQAYGYASNRAFVRHGGTAPSTLTRLEAEFFLEFAASCIVYITAKLKHGKADA